MRARMHVLTSAVAIALGATACGTTTVTRHKSLSSAAAGPTMGFGIGHTSSESSSFGHSESLSDVRVDHAADWGEGTRDRIWRLAPASGPVIPGLVMQRLELCTKDGGRCTAAQWVDGEGQTSREASVSGKTSELAGMPVLVEDGMLGGSSRVSRVAGATMYGAVETTTRSGVVREAESRRATPAFGVWTLLSPVTAQGAIFAIGTVGGAPAFCHAPPGAAPRCVTPSKPPPVARILAVDVLRRGESLRHVLWYQARTLATYDTISVPSGTIVRCEADDATAAPTCETTEVKP